MAITLDSNLLDENMLFSLEAPFPLRWTKDVNATPTEMTVTITQGSFSKVLNFKYNSLIKDFTFNLSEAVKIYYQSVDFTDNGDIGARFFIRFYNEQRFMNVSVSISDSDNTVTYTQNFVNSVGKRIANYNGFVFPTTMQVNEFSNVYKKADSFDTIAINIPLKLFIFGNQIPIAPSTTFRLLVKDSSGVTQANEGLTTQEVDDNLVARVELTPPPVDDFYILEFNYEREDDFAGTLTRRITYRIYNSEKCNGKVTVVYSDIFGGWDNFIFNNYSLSFEKKFNPFTLQDGKKVRIDDYSRKSGVLNSDMLKKYDNERMEQVFLSKKTAIKDYPNDFVSLSGYTDIFFTSPRFRKLNDYDPDTPVNYNLAFEEVEKLIR